MTHRGFRSAAVALAVAFAAGAGACGDSDDGGDAATAGQGKESTQTQTDAVDATGTPSEQVRATYQRMRASFEREDPAGVCAEMTAEAQRRTVELATGNQKTCDGFVAWLLKEYGDKIKGKPILEGIRVNGDKAILTIRTGDTVKDKVPAVKTPEGWKLDEAIQIV